MRSYGERKLQVGVPFLNYFIFSKPHLLDNHNRKDDFLLPASKASRPLRSIPWEDVGFSYGRGLVNGRESQKGFEILSQILLFD